MQYTSEKLRLALYADGTDGNGIKEIKNYYYASTSNNINDIPPKGSTDWKPSVSELKNQFNETYKFLWGYEEISYTEKKDSTTTNITLMAVYSKDGVGIKGVHEFYICTEEPGGPTSLPTLENLNGWTKSGTLPIPSAETPYLWNYEIIEYTVGSPSTSGPVCIGSYGNSITQTIEWYQATSTSDPPQNKNGEAGDWKKTIAETGHGSTKPYLWNYEEIKYSMTADIKTDITLLSASPRTIVSITEYYQQLPIGSDAPEGVSWEEEDENIQNKPPIVDPEVWKPASAELQLQQGNIMWNMEVVEYAAVDGDGKNLYTATTPAPIGYAGINAQDFYVIASSYVLIKESEDADEYKNTVILTPKLRNLTGVVQYSTDQKTWYDLGNDPSLEVDTPGTYYWRLKDTSWQDQVTIAETIDGTQGRDAIAIVLSNPYMVFYEDTTSGLEQECEVIVYEGGTPLIPRTDGSGFVVSFKGSAVMGSTIDGAKVKIPKQNSDGSCTITVKVSPTVGSESSKDFTIHWKYIDKISSPYTIVLVEDFVSIPCDNEGNIYEGFDFPELSPVVYYGEKRQDNWSLTTTIPTSGTDLKLYVSAEKISVDCSDGKTIALSNMNDDRATVTLKLYKGIDIKDTLTFEATKQRAGDPGNSATYLYTLVEPNVLNKDNKTDLNLTTYKREGVKEPEETTAYYTYSIDGNTFNNATGTTISKNSIDTAQNKIQICSYSDAGRTFLIDKNTIQILENGKDGANAQYLYHDGTDDDKGVPNPPDQNLLFEEYAQDGTEDTGGWYIIQKDSSLYMTHRIVSADVDETTVPWGPVTLVTGKPTYDSIWEAFDNAVQETKDANGIYPFTDPDTGKNLLGINADLIRTGTLLVGKAEKDGTPNEETIFKAQFDGDKPFVYLAGWQTDGISLYATRGEGSLLHKYIGLSARGEAFDGISGITLWSGVKLEKKKTIPLAYTVDQAWAISKEEYSIDLQQLGSNFYERDNEIIVQYCDNDTLETTTHKDYFSISEKSNIQTREKEYVISCNTAPALIDLEPISQLGSPEIYKPNLYSYRIVSNQDKAVWSSPINYYVAMGNSWPGSVRAVYDSTLGAYISIQCGARGASESGMCVFEQQMQYVDGMSFKVRIDKDVDTGRWLTYLRLCEYWETPKDSALIHLALGFDQYGYLCVYENDYYDKEDHMTCLAQLSFLNEAELSQTFKFTFKVIGDDQSRDIKIINCTVSDDQGLSKTFGEWRIEEVAGHYPRVLRVVPFKGCTSEIQIFDVLGGGYTEPFCEVGFPVQVSATLSERYKGIATPNWYVTNEGEMVAEKGRIGALKIEEIPEEGYMASSANSAFSWEFSPTKGVFMWDGPQHTSTDVDADGQSYGPTQGAVFAIYDDKGTKKLYMKGNGEFTGKIFADEGGEIGSLRIQNGGLESDFVKINPSNVTFPTQGSLVLGDEDVVLGRWTDGGTDQASIVTNGSLPFVIKNRGGAGIKFVADEGTQTSTNVLTITLKTGTSDSLTIGSTFYDTCFWFEYSFSNGGSLVPLNRTINYKVVYSGNRVSSGYVNLQIPAMSTFGTCIVTGIAGSNEYTMHWDKTHSKPNYIYMSGLGFTDVNSITFSCSGKWSITGSRWKSLSALGKETFTSHSNENNVLYSLGHLFPETKNDLFLGSGCRPWGSLTVQNAVVTSSDKRLKNSIQQMTEPYEKFYDGLKPVMYKYNNGTSDRLHSGFIAQQVEESLNLANINTKDFAGICIDDSDGSPYFLRYSEFISLNTWQIQKLKSRVLILEQTKLAYETRISNLETEIQNLKSV